MNRVDQMIISYDRAARKDPYNSHLRRSTVIRLYQLIRDEIIGQYETESGPVATGESHSKAVRNELRKEQLTALNKVFGREA